MAELKVEVVVIKEVTKHPDADRLDIVKMEGLDYVCVSGKGNFKKGDLAFYFPVDAVLPEKWVKEFGIENFYSKRLRAAKIRGIFSEGLLIPAEKYWPKEVSTELKPGVEVSGVFGVTKYEAPIPKEMSGQVIRPVTGREIFPEPEHFQKYNSLLVEGEEVVITEKYHGANFGAAKTYDDVLISHSHNYWMKNNEANKNNVFVRVINENPEFANLPKLVHVYGEVLGVQDLKYGLKNGKIDYVLFAAKVNDRFLNIDEFQDLCNKYGLKRVNVLYRGPYSKDKVLQFNNADTTHTGASHMMEGCVVQPVKEREEMSLGKRLVLKYVSERYKLRRKGTEWK